MPKKSSKKRSSRPAAVAKVRQVAQNPTNQAALGLILIFLALYLAGAFLSYFLHWQADQDLVGQSFWSIMQNPQIQTENVMGKIGAGLAHFFIFRGFGLAAFLFPWFLLITGLRLSFKVRLVHLARNLASTLFFLLWLPCTLDFLQADAATWSGALGYYGHLWLVSWAGSVGTAAILLFSLLLFLAIRFSWTAERLRHFFQRLTPQKTAGGKESEKEAAEAAPLPTAENEQKQTEEDREIASEAEALSLDLEESSEPDEPVRQTESDQEAAENSDLEIEATEEEEALSEKELNRKVKEFGEYDPKLDLSRFKLPTIDLLKDYGSANIKVNQEELEENKNKIVNTLNNYNIEISKIKATIGPTVTLYEIIPAAGVRISKIKNLEDDIALSLAALGIRIIAPIPGRGTIGIEVPSTSPQIVPMRNLIAGEKFQQSDLELPIALGKTISNETLIADLAKMPHLLMAGATGQGKSVGLNAILTSLLYKKHPSQVKFVLVDPKKVELTLFNKIERHYLAKLPDTEEAIITDTKKVINTLNSLCIEMDNRYELLKNAMTRNIKEYNTKFIHRKLNPEEGHRYLPYIVLVIDEFADLIMTAGKEVETPIARLAQLARAIGIHLIVATQRPSVNVITGIIKANFPARIAFRVTSKVDSRTILDAGGAEQLIGKGDMLLSQGQDLIRLQCAFVDTPEVENITDYIGNQQAYPDAYQLPEYKGEEDDSSAVDILDPSERDALFEDAARLLVIHQQGSASLLQRKLKLGYNRAGRIIDQLEAAGIIGPFEGSKARQVLVSDEGALEQLLKREKDNS